jgi:hypothetical protein
VEKLCTQDRTVAYYTNISQRRRTQIRLAQRAYRQRKETTIASLKKQRSQLHGIINEMNKTFLHYNESIAQSGVLQLNSGLAGEIKKMNEEIANCVKTANERILESDEEEAVVTEPVQALRTDVAQVVATETSPSRISASTEDVVPWGYAMSSQASERSRAANRTPQPGSYLSRISSSSYDLPESNNHNSLTRRYHYTVGEVLDQSRSAKLSYQSRVTEEGTHEQQQQDNPASLPFGLLDIPSREQSPFVPPYIFPIDVPAMGAELPPPARAHQSYTLLTDATPMPALSYSYEEVTFARRLTRATLEAGILLLSSPHIHPAILQHIFKLSLPYQTPEQICNRFKTILSRGVTEDLDWYATPFIHLGGAGTHYQRRDANGKLIPLKNTWTIRSFGPLERHMIRLESVSDGQTQDLQGIDLAGFEGEWFDAHDVQGYLEEHWHCKIDARSSFAECLVDDDSAPLWEREARSPSLSRGSTASNSDVSTPPAVPPFNPFQPSFGLPMSLDSGPISNSFPAPPKHGLAEVSFDQTLGLDLAPGFDMGFGGRSGYNMLGLNMMGEAEQLPTVKQKAKKAAWVDVQKLIDSKSGVAHFGTWPLLTVHAALMKGAVCLGRAPGFRRKDVDIAFRNAIIHI